MKDKLSLILLALLSVWNVSAQVTTIPDPFFEQELVDLGIDSDGIVNGQVLTSDVEGVTQLMLNGWEGNSNISDLTGLEDFAALEHLQVIFTEITELDVTQNAQLKVLNCRSNYLTEIDVSSNPLLEELHIGNESDVAPFVEVTEIDLSNNPNIQKLFADNIFTLDRINLKNGNNDTAMDIDISIIVWDDNPDPDPIYNHVCIEVDDVELALANQVPYSGWEIDYVNVTYNFADDCTLGTPDVNLSQLISIYPNPSSDRLNFTVSDGVTLEKVQLYDALGRFVSEHNDLSGQSISVSSLARGVYIIKVFSDKGTYTQKTIVE